ncbi:MAG: hypothetical protein M3T56_02690 [Chloroflexota bacterium]|nr:hypothetical protein [Chloroflexota bacterium]
MSGETSPDRSELWLPLLRRLTQVSSSWLVWKNVDSALFGIGDIDAAAAEGDSEMIQREFFSWARERRVGPVVVCTHIPGGLNLIAIPPRQQTFLEFSVKARKAFRGGTLFVLEDLTPLIEMDPRGFRRLRSGAEGLLKLVLNGMRWGGRPNPVGLREKHVPELLRADPSGVALAAKLFGPAEHAAVAGAEAVARGAWNRRAMLTIETFAVARALRHPLVLGQRVWFRTRTKQTCPVVRAILVEGRRIPADRDRWLRLIESNHAVLETDLVNGGSGARARQT